MSWLSNLWAGLNTYYDWLCPVTYHFFFPSLVANVFFFATSVIRIVDSEKILYERALKKNGKHRALLLGLLMKLSNVLVFYCATIQIANQTEHNLAVGLIFATVLFGGWYGVKLLDKRHERGTSE